MSRVYKLVLTWGLAVATVLVLLLSTYSVPAVSAKSISDGPVVGTDPGTEVPGDNDGISGIKFRLYMYGEESDGIRSTPQTQENSTDSLLNPTSRHVIWDGLWTIVQFWFR